ncbi:MAG: ATP-binding cassette domain-containing protein [Ramlibacter sp.]|uniref:ABC-F family ATP-binding cassette domain-containing protein n=1 Tax=Ramlibacter sp. TaxID=1917967 RepID=UPI002613BA7F|nr:ATP-binding cassette domain-containing protein [Ramlibacter sp.]MDH4378182.1 ATP-binding cassette domain-containing protein [Ramlibacter sp.]
MITLRDVILRRGTKVLLDKVSLTLNPGEKAGLVGRNGAGKSTLFALFDGSLHEDGGEFSRPAHWQMAQVAQNMPETDEPATDFVLAGDTRLMAVQARLDEAEARLHEFPDDADAGMAVGQAHADLHDAGVHDAVPRAQALILGLGFTTEQLHRPVNSFSGGWRMRLQLARALMCPSDLLLLDEPTNHLDLDALVWLEAWLQRYAGTLIVISHDREFLDAVTTVTVHIDAQRLTRYGGNYSAFELLRAQQLELQQSAFAKQQDKIAHLQKFIDRFKAKASKAKQAQSRVKALERLEKVAPVLADADFNFEFKEPDNLPNPMLAISDAAFGYRAEDGTATTIVQKVDRSVLAGQRIGILGANGQGKSTLVKTIAHTLPLLAGTLTEGKGLNIGYFAQQELDVLSPPDHPLMHMIRLARDVGPQAREQELRNFLGSFNFSGDMVSQPVGTMSGGEKARLVLAMIVWQRPNLLLLDEPTNHLDLATREALSIALNEFEGTVMLVSHDRALLRAVCDEFWLVGRGGIKPFDGDLDDYQKYLLEESRRLREVARQQAATATAKTTTPAATTAAIPAESSLASPPATAEPAPAHQVTSAAQAPPAPQASPGGSRQQSAQARQALAATLRPLKKAQGEAERRMTELETEKAGLEAQLSRGLSPAEIAEAGRRLKGVGEELAQLEERWLELSGEIEAAQAA